MHFSSGKFWTEQACSLAQAEPTGGRGHAGSRGELPVAIRLAQQWGCCYGSVHNIALLDAVAAVTVARWLASQVRMPHVQTPDRHSTSHGMAPGLVTRYPCPLCQTSLTKVRRALRLLRVESPTHKGLVHVA